MKKYFIEHNGIPGIISYHNYDIDDVTFIVVYIDSDANYQVKYFDTISEALDFLPDNDSKLIFVEIEWERDGEGIKYIAHKHIDFIDNKFIVSLHFRKMFKGFMIEIYLYRGDFFINKLKSGTDDSLLKLRYERIGTSKENQTEELLDSFYELVPRFEDEFLETLFFFEIIKANISINDREQIKAYFLQAKLLIEKNKKPNENKKKKIDELDNETPLSEEQIKLENLIGLTKIKLEIQELQALANLRQKRIELQLPATPTTLHMVFTGNPGTGKTTAARLLGQIYYDIGILAENKVIEASRQDLVGEYVGHTAPKTQKLFEKAIGGILFIDEAYSLFKTGNDFGKEVVETLLKLMEDNREKIVVIIAGYPSEMEELLNSNPGLKSRFSKFLQFDDYSKKELGDIFKKMVSDYQNSLTEGAKFKIDYLIDTYYDRGAFNSNARSIRNIFEETTKRQSLRLSKMKNPTQEDMTTFTDKDLPDNLE